MKRQIVTWLIPFFVIFNLGYVFHEIVVHDFMTERIGAITRSSYIIPLIALSFAIYVAILVYLYPIFLAYYRNRWRPITIGAWICAGALKRNRGRAPRTATETAHGAI